MYPNKEYLELVSKYGAYSSWAIWNHKNQKDSLIIDKNIEDLHSKFVLLGLNISKPLKGGYWINFRLGKHDRKLKYACNETLLRGSYITDIFKGIDEPNSGKLKDSLTNELINKNVNIFKQEMKDIKIDDETCFIVLGTPNSLLAQYFNKYFKQKYNNKVIYYYHYSYYKLTDRQWVQGLWKKLGIIQNFDEVVKKYE